MLLDNEDVLASASSRMVNETPFDDPPPEAFHSDPYEKRQHSLGGHFEDERGCDGDELGRDEQFGSDRVGQHFGDEDNSAQGYHNPSSTEADARPYIPEPSISPILGTPFSPTFIKHPIPQSSKVSSILHSSS